ncbi:ArsR/SmtB family transcription factor [Pseudarthrobacter sp. LT1]|uniref:ArsR/SmtB family transcription factor n=1 Tax=Pseudarthrobacter sp. LT1 TaxID=3111450 RepID=UPI003B63F4D5
MNRTRSRLLRFLIAHGPASCGDASLALGLSQSTVRRQIMLLCDAGLVSPLAGSFSAQVEQIEMRMQELSAGLRCPVTDLRNSDQEGALLSESSFHSCECPGTAEETS